MSDINLPNTPVREDTPLAFLGGTSPTPQTSTPAAAPLPETKLDGVMKPRKKTAGLVVGLMMMLAAVIGLASYSYFVYGNPNLIAIIVNDVGTGKKNSSGVSDTGSAGTGGGSSGTNADKKAMNTAIKKQNEKNVAVKQEKKSEVVNNASNVDPRDKDTKYENGIYQIVRTLCNAGSQCSAYESYLRNNYDMNTIIEVQNQIASGKNDWKTMVVGYEAYVAGKQTSGCANGYYDLNGDGKCEANTDTVSCGRNLDTNAPICCNNTTSCAGGEIVCEPPGRKECKTGTGDSEVWCLMEANSSWCGGKTTGGGTTTATETSPAMSCTSITKTPSAPVIGNTVTLTCLGSVTPSTAGTLSYKFRYSINGGTYTALTNATDTTATLTIAACGTYSVQCQACATLDGVLTCDPDWTGATTN